MSYSQQQQNPNPQRGGQNYSGPQQNFPQWNPNASQSGYNPGYQGNPNASQYGYNPGNSYNQGYTASTDFGSQQNYQQPQQYSQQPQQYSQQPQQWGQHPYNVGPSYGSQGMIGAPPQQSTAQSQWQSPAAPHQQYSGPNHHFASGYTNFPSQPPFPNGSAPQFFSQAPSTLQSFPQTSSAPQSGHIPSHSPPTAEAEASAADTELPPNVRKLLKRFRDALYKAEQDPRRLRFLRGLPSEETQETLCTFGAEQQLDEILIRWRSLLEKKRVLLSENKKLATVSKLVPDDPPTASSAASTSRSTTTTCTTFGIDGGSGGG